MAMPTPLPSSPLIPWPVRLRMAAVPVASSSALGAVGMAVRDVMRLGEMPCTSASAAMSITRPAGNMTDSAATDV